MPNLAAKNLIKFPNAIYFVSIFLILLLTLVYLVYEIHRQLTISAKQEYIGLVSANLISADQSIDELIDTINIDKANYEKIIANPKAEEDINYNIIVENNQKSLLQIESLINNVDFQKKLLLDSKTPEEYADLESNFDNYYAKYSQLLDELASKYELENNILISIVSGSTADDISRKTVWEAEDIEAITNHFQLLKFNVDASFSKLSAINPPSEYKDYHNLYASYLTLLSSTSQDIVDTLNVQVVDENSDLPKPVEIAHQKAIRSQNELSKLGEKINKEREEVFSSKSSKEDIKKLADMQDSLEDEIKNLYQLLYRESNSNRELSF